MLTAGCNKNFSIKFRLRKINIHLTLTMSIVNNFGIFTSELSFAGIFPFVLRSLWNPITPSSQMKICSTTDSPAVNIYF